MEARQFFTFHFKGKPSKDQQKTFRRRLITFKVTLTGQSHFMRILWLRKVTLRSHINSVKWPPHTQSHAGECAPPWIIGRGGHTLLRLRGRGGSQFGRLEKKPSFLSTSCYVRKKYKIPPNESYCTVQYSTAKCRQHFLKGTYNCVAIAGPVSGSTRPTRWRWRPYSTRPSRYSTRSTSQTRQTRYPMLFFCFKISSRIHRSLTGELKPV